MASLLKLGSEQHQHMTAVMLGFQTAVFVAVTEAFKLVRKRTQGKQSPLLVSVKD